MNDLPLRAGLILLTSLVLVGAPACVTVRAQQRAVLADPVMQFNCEPHWDALRIRAVGGREGSFANSETTGGGRVCK